MKISLFKKLAFGFLLSVIIAIVATSIISNLMISSRFNDYLVAEQKSKIEKMTKITEGLYNEKTGFSDVDMEEIKRYSSMEKLFVEVKDINGKTISSYDNTSTKEKSKQQSMMGSMMENNDEGKKGNYSEVKYNLQKNNKKIGYIVVGYFDNSYINSDALNFKMTLNQAFTLSALIALLLGFFISMIFSRQLSKPLLKITNVANKIRNGDLNARCEVKTNTKEIIELSRSMNFLGSTLKAQEMLRKSVTSDMAHELRTPLSILKAHIEAMLDGIWEPTKERLESFYEEIERLIKLVNNLRNLSKLEEVNLVLNRSKFNIEDLLANIIKNFEPMYSKKNYKLTINTISVIVFMDKDKIIQIMDNVLSNAYKYLEDNGEVNIILKKVEDDIVIEIKDNGIGISQKDLPYIFERFYRGDKSRSRNTGGSGIGLTITKALVEAHGGKIEVYSEKGKGSEFVIILPTKNY